MKTNILQVKDELDKIIIDSEAIENYNKLINDKLDELNGLNINQTREDLLSDLWELKRYSECYITLNYSITQEIIKIQESVKKINNLLEACKNDNK